MPENDEDLEADEEDGDISEPEKEEEVKSATSSEPARPKDLPTEIIKGETFYRCPYPKCEFKSKKSSSVWGHIRFIHLYRGEHLTEDWDMVKGPPLTKIPRDFPLNKKIKPNIPMLSKPAPRKVEHTTENEDESENADSGRKSEVKGKLRQLLKAVSASDPEHRDALMPTREVLMDYIKVLAKARVSDQELDEIQNAYEDKLRPDVEYVLGKDVVGKFTGNFSPQSSAASKMPALTALAKLSRMRGVVKQYLGTLAKLPPSKRDELASERETLLMLTRRLSTKDIAEEELNEMDDLIEGEIRPTVDSAVSAIQKAPAPRKENTLEDSGVIDLQHKKEELELARMDRMMAEESLRHKQTVEAMRSTQNNNSGSMVPVMRPKMDERGNVVKDEEGRPVMETTYAPIEQAGGMNNMLMTMLLTGKLGGGDGAMAAILPAILDNNTKVLVAMLDNNSKKSNGPSTEELMLKMQNENMRMMMEINKGKGEDPMLAQMREDLRATRDAQVSTQNSMHAQQLDYMRREMEDLKRYAYRDDFDSVLKQKARLEELGLVTSNQKDADTKALEESRKAMDTMGQKFDGVREDTKSLFAPLVEAQAELLKGQARSQGLRRPAQPSFSEEQKKGVYKQMLENIEQGEDAEGEPEA